AEAVLGGAKRPVRALALAFELQHRVDEMLEHPRAREASLLRHVAHEHHHDLKRLGDTHDLVGNLTHLTDRPGGTRPLTAMGPPPSTASSSPIPLLRRAWSTASTSASITGVCAAARRLAPAPEPACSARGSSRSVFHSPQPGHRPSHRGLCLPHAQQTKIEVR